MWEDIVKQIDSGIASFQSIMTDADYVSKNSNKVNKIYVALNELKNSCTLKDREVFLIKYKNALEELNSIE